MSCRNLRWVMTRIRRAINTYKMIESKDRIAVGISGGKDSVTLLYLLSLLKNYSAFDFTLVPIHLSLGWESLGLSSPDLSPIEDFCSRLSLNLHIKKTQISEVIFVARQESNPCSLCAKMRRGALHNAALELGCNKVALGHHLDDAVETLFLNLFYTGRFSSFSPNTYLSRKNLVLIRPLVYLREQTITKLANKKNLPIITNPCPADKQSKRHEVKKIIHHLESYYPDIREKILTALVNLDQESRWSTRSISNTCKILKT